MNATASGINLTPVRPNPWTKLGQPIDLRETDDRTVLARAGLDWKVRLAGLYTDGFNPLPKFRAVVREDTGIALGVVSPDYQPMQPDQLIGFMRALSAQAPVVVESAGIFKRGAVTFIQARMPNLDLTIGADHSHSLLTLVNGSDGRRPLSCGFQTRRIVCMNSLEYAVRTIKGNRNRTDLAKGHVIRHTAGLNAALGDMLNAYRSAIDGHRQTRDLYQHLAGTLLTKSLERQFYERVFAAEGPDESERAASLRKAREERMQAILTSPTSRVPGTVGSAFALMQAAVEYIDFYRPTRTSDGESAEAARMFSSQFGSGQALKKKAVETIAELTAA
jgi:phage/plasmid-like protein (TIGR03299 family)